MFERLGWCFAASWGIIKILLLLVVVSCCIIGVAVWIYELIENIKNKGGKK